MTQYTPGNLYEGAVLLAGYVHGAGLTMLRSDEEAVRWQLEPDGRTARPGRQVVRFQVANLERFSVEVPPLPYLKAKDE